MTFNLRGSFIDDGENAWSNRSDLCARTILKQEPDLIGFQEAQQGNLDSLERDLSGYEREVGPRYNNREPFAYPSVFWKPEKLEKVESGEFWLSRTPDRFSADWETEYIRSALWIRFRRRETGAVFVHLNTHLDNTSAEARVEGSRVILNRLRQEFDKETPLLVTGDFNCVPGSPPYEVFREAGFRDAHREAGHPDNEEVFTFHRFTGKREPGRERIDWILFRDSGDALAVRDYRIVRDSEPPLYPSDHYAVVADLTW